jgi:hypothetical protein
MAAFRCCGRPAPTATDGDPTDQPSLSSPDPSEVSQAYWLAARRASIRCGGAIITQDELQRKGKALESLADGERAWAGLSQNYARSAAMNTDAVEEIGSLPQDRVDRLAVACVTELADFLTFQATLLRQSSEECAEMAALFAIIHAEGDAFDRDGPKGKEYDRREADLTAKMKKTVGSEGAAQKRRFAELATKAEAAATTLAKKHGRQFPDLLGK